MMIKISKKLVGSTVVLLSTCVLSTPLYAVGLGGGPRPGGFSGARPSVSRPSVARPTPGRSTVPNIPRIEPGKRPTPAPNRVPGGNVRPQPNIPPHGPGREPGRGPSMEPSHGPRPVTLPERPNVRPGQRPGPGAKPTPGQGIKPGPSGKPAPGHVVQPPRPEIHSAPHPGRHPGNHHVAPPPHPVHHPAPHPGMGHPGAHPFHYDVHSHDPGWHPHYRPVYPWWVHAAEVGVGYAIGSYIAGGQRVYYYYPEAVVVESGTTVVVESDASGAEETVITEDVLPEVDAETVTDAETGADVESGTGAESQSILEDATEVDAVNIPKVTKAEIDGAWESIQKGDEAFVNGDLTAAEKLYADTSAAVSAMPDPWFRLTFTEIARGNYTKAAEYCTTAMNASRYWPTSPFSLDYLYQGQDARKNENLDMLEKAAINAPKDGNLNLLAGLAFYSDGQTAPAAKYFKKAQNISPELKDFVEPMLKEIE
ncbi:MAG: hypothetical protein Q4C70_09780 [Planctomycetia bacterium]|nr:hypothetical protein [Planctomycetia bacterium]